MASFTSKAKKDLYLIGQSVFKELVWRSFLQDVEEQEYGLMRCKMHDLMHDLAESVTKQETYRMADDGVQKIPLRVRHLSCARESLEMIEEKMDQLELLRVYTLHSFISFGPYKISVNFGKFVFSFSSNQQHLRVLDMRFCHTKELPYFVHKWEQLRFLSMSCDGLRKLPESITCLHNLQTLKLTYTYELRKLPEGLKYMKNLWFVEIDNFRSFICTPPGLGELTSLQRLGIFIVGEDSAHQISQLKELNLGGELCIRELENVRNLEEAKGADMIRKRNLKHLKLSWTRDTNKISMEQFEAALEGIQPHHNLEKIHILNYQGSRFPNWISDPMFTNLSEISLESCRKCEHLPFLGELPALKVLQLVGFNSIRRLAAEWCGDRKRSFVALTELCLQEMPNLEEWIIPNSHQSFFSLRSLNVNRCPKLIILPFLAALTKLETDMNPAILGSMMATSVESIWLSGDDDEISLVPGGLLSAQKNLKDLLITSCANLRSLSIMSDGLYALKKLELFGCTRLEHPPEGLEFLNSLEKLRISCCNSLRLFPAATLENMASLRYLSFSSCRELDPLSGPLQSVVTNLHELEISFCPKLKSLPESIQELSALRTLRIPYCEGICWLPEWIGNLKSLSLLSIKWCGPILARRCEKLKGEDWHKISHVPNIVIW